MAGYGAYFFCREGDLESVLRRLDALLGSAYPELRRTRKGRVWEARSLNQQILDVTVSKTGELLDEVEDELLDLGLLPEDAPLVVAMYSRLNGPDSLSGLRTIVERMSEIIDGVATSPGT